GRGRSWPDRLVFSDRCFEETDKNGVARTSITAADTDQPIWFDVTSQRIGKDTLHIAVNATDTVNAEQSKAKAMETSSRLFANLSTGLAIFDQQRRLATFNPRLTDLTRLEPRFLMRRPTIDMFLDALRESRVLPEPKNYATWREQFTALEDSARAGTYCENWELIDGQTFRVTGKPYDDKSFVFLFDDITAEVDLTRRFKTDIATGQGVMDVQKHGIAVFSANGTMVMSNKVYKELWQSDHDASITSHQLRGEIAIWQSHCAAGPTWTDLRSFIARTSGTKTWIDHAILEDGRHILCEAENINDNMTVVSFRAEAEQKIPPIIHKLSMPDPSLQRAKR
ncbi:MAG: PAS-domain containing protein, partial [Pseudomonadota bacterium]